MRVFFPIAFLVAVFAVSLYLVPGFREFVLHKKTLTSVAIVVMVFVVLFLAAAFFSGASMVLFGGTLPSWFSGGF